MAPKPASRRSPPPKDEVADSPEDLVTKDDVETVTRFPPEEEAGLVAESNARKTEANTLFSAKKYEPALAKYDEAVTVCPNYLDYEVAVLKSNIAACHLKLEEWKDAISAATGALEGLDRVDREATAAAAAAAETEAKPKPDETPAKTEEEEDDDVEEEIISTGATKAAPAPKPEEKLSPEEAARRQRKEDVLRIRAKALMRRAKARSELGGWSVLAAAEEDYKALAAMPNLGAADRRIVQQQLRALPPRVKEAQSKETAEMWGKLKELGNGILSPFGLSTDNFQMVQDEKTGGYSMNFKSNDQR